MSVFHSNIQKQVSETSIDINTPRNPFTLVTNTMIHFGEPHWSIWQKLEMWLVWIQKFCVGEEYIKFQNIVKITKSLHNLVMLITPKCFLFSKMDMKVEGKWAGKKNGLTEGGQEKDMGGYDPCVDI